MQLSKDPNKKHFTHLISYVEEDYDIAAYETSGTSLGSNDEDLDMVHLEMKPLIPHLMTIHLTLKGHLIL